ncbi:MAG: hypothetical protein ACLSHM_04310 [Vescimonas sp.]
MKKKEKNAVIKTCLDILPVRSWEPSVGAFLLADSSYLDLLRLVPRDLQNIAEDELELEIYQFTKVLKTVGCDLKFLSMRFPLSLERQKAVRCTTHGRPETRPASAGWSGRSVSWRWPRPISAPSISILPIGARMRIRSARTMT